MFVTQENPSKRSLQRFILGRILRHPHNHDDVTIVCMPGTSCWDISFLTSNQKFSRKIRRIIAVEKDPDVAAVIRQKTAGNPIVDVYEGSTTSFLMSLTYPVDIFYFDFCSNLNLSVIQDIRILFRRRLLQPKGKCIVNLYGARELETDQIAQKLLFDDLDQMVGSGETWDDIDPDRKRCLAFNSLVGSFRFTPTSPSVRKGSEHLYATTTAPLWHRYRSHGGASMLTGYFTLNTYTKATTQGAMKLALDCWFVRGAWGIRDINRKNFSGLGSAGEKMCIRDTYKQEVLTFYNKNHYTPTVHDIGRTSVRDWRGIIQELGLCPRSEATVEDIKGEIRRIYEREGMVRMEHLKKAKLTRKKIITTNSTTTAAYRRLLDEMGIGHDLYSEVRKLRDLRKYAFIHSYIQHVEAGLDKSKFPHYSYMAKLKVRGYSDALAELRRLQKQGVVIPTALQLKKCILEHDQENLQRDIRLFTALQEFIRHINEGHSPSSCPEFKWLQKLKLTNPDSATQELQRLQIKGIVPVSPI